MARKKDSPQKAALRELMGNYLKENNEDSKQRMEMGSEKMLAGILEALRGLYDYILNP